jgi:predicted protein tyrosine phosphatase
LGELLEGRPLPYVNGLLQDDERVLIITILPSSVMKARSARLDLKSPKELLERRGKPKQQFHVPLEDEGPSPNQPWWDTWERDPGLSELRFRAVPMAIEWMQRSPEHKVFIHCFGGRSRSVTLACLIVMELMPGLGRDYLKAREIVKQRRSLALQRGVTARAVATGYNNPCEQLLKSEGDPELFARLQKNARDEVERKNQAEKWEPTEPTTPPPRCAACKRILCRCGIGK